VSRLNTIGVTGALVAATASLELIRPGFLGLTFDVAIKSGKWFVLAAVIAWAGYMACRIKHHPAIRDAGVERFHEKRITAFRAHETARLTLMAPGDN
jgi:hypothetical protein